MYGSYLIRCSYENSEVSRNAALSRLNYFLKFTHEPVKRTAKQKSSCHQPTPLSTAVAHAELKLRKSIIRLLFQLPGVPEATTAKTNTANATTNCCVGTVAVSEASAAQLRYRCCGRSARAFDRSQPTNKVFISSTGSEKK